MNLIRRAKKSDADDHPDDEPFPSNSRGFLQGDAKEKSANGESDGVDEFVESHQLRRHDFQIV